MIGLLALLAFGCARPRSGSVETFGFQVSEEIHLLQEVPDSPPEEEGLFLPGRGYRKTPLYVLDLPPLAPVMKEPAVSMFFLRYSSLGEQLYLSLDQGDDTPLRILLPESNGTVTEYRVPLPAGIRIHSFQVQSPASATSVQILDAGITGGEISWVLKADEPVIYHGLIIRKTRTEVLIDYSSLPAEMELAGLPVRLEYELPEAAEPHEEAFLAFMGDDGAKWFRFIPSQGRQTLYLYPRALDARPSSIQLVGLPPEFTLTGVFFDRDAIAADDPITADFGTVLEYDQRLWRNPDYEVFRWSLMPGILFMDTRNYRVQADFFKRLAFYVEKAGTKHQLLPNEVIHNLHGWNAHDYRAEDLAHFFTSVDSTGFVLNPEEILLRDLLTRQGIIISKETGYEAGMGGIISISRESPLSLRYKFATHEGYHGVFFSSETYQDAVFESFHALEEIEQLFWKIFLGWKTYDPKNEYLVANEFQAYLMQQPVNQVTAYFINHSLPLLLRDVPTAVPLIGSLPTEKPYSFVDAANVLGRVLWETTGIGPLDLICLNERDLKNLPAEYR